MREQREKNPSVGRNLRLKQSLVAVFSSGLISLVASGGIHVAFADSPAVTDFGQDTEVATMAGHEQQSRALFLTFYPDGHQQMEVRVVQGDAVVGFAGEHPTWRLDAGLMWFLQMPVYVRDLSNQGSPSRHDAV